MEYTCNWNKVEFPTEKVALVRMNNVIGKKQLPVNSPDSIKEMRKIFCSLNKDPDANVIVLYGNENAFNVGSDLRYKGHYEDPVELKFRIESELMNDIEYCSKPVIAAIEGFCMGGGMELAISCDFRYMAENATVSLPEINLAAYSYSGGPIRLPKIVGYSRALKMLMTGGKYSGREAREMGLADEVFPAGTVLQEALAFADVLAKKPPLPLRMIKKLCKEYYFKPSTDCFHDNLAHIPEVFYSENVQEGRQAFLEKREPEFNLTL